jgi:hypothetical protein
MIRTHVVLLSLAVAALGGCMSASPNLDRGFGQSARNAVALQTLNPTAGRDTALPALADAQTARNALTKQRDSYKTPPPTFNVIGVTASSAAQ